MSRAFACESACEVRACASCVLRSLSRPFFVLGEVTTSGQFPYVNGMTVQTAVAIAGGYTPRAAKDYAELTRQGSEGRLVTASVPITFPVRPGDTIVIKERWF